MPLADRYTEALQSIPPPGAGCHPYLLTVANLGVIAGVDPKQMHSDISKSIPHGRRRVSGREIQDTIQKALSDRQDRIFIPKPNPRPAIEDGKNTLKRIIESSSIDNEADLWEASPIRLQDEPKKDTVIFLQALYDPDDYVFIGERHESGIIGRTIRTAAEWMTYFQNGGKTAPHIITNPLSGTPALTMSGDKETLRGDACVMNFRYCLVEFDVLGREEQIKFWAAVNLPVVALIDSGGRSIHGWLDVKRLANVEKAEQWETEIKQRLYERILKPMGADGACSNPARLSRLTGHFRNEKNTRQKLLWLSSEGRPVNAGRV